MKNLLSIAAVLAALSITACGGGSPNNLPIPIVSPTAKPVSPPSPVRSSVPVVYSAHIAWTGPLATNVRNPSSALRRLDDSSSTPSPVLVAINANDNPGPGGQLFNGAEAPAQVNVTINPAPSSPPVVTYSDTSPDVSVSPPPFPSPSPDSIGVYPGSQAGPSTLTATLTSPSVMTQTISVITLNSFQISCSPYTVNGSPWGIIFNTDGSVTTTSDTNLADLYFTGPGPSCTAAFQTPAGSNYYLTAPSGIVQLGTGQNPVDFPSVTMASFVTPVTQIEVPTDGLQDSTDFQYGQFILKTRLGQYVKYIQAPPGTSCYGCSAGNYETSLASGTFPY